jgi:hypothetical protein
MEEVRDMLKQNSAKGRRAAPPVRHISILINAQKRLMSRQEQEFERSQSIFKHVNFNKNYSQNRLIRELIGAMISLRVSYGIGSLKRDYYFYLPQDIGKALNISLEQLAWYERQYKEDFLYSTVYAAKAAQQFLYKNWKAAKDMTEESIKYYRREMLGFRKTEEEMCTEAALRKELKEFDGLFAKFDSCEKNKIFMSLALQPDAAERKIQFFNILNMYLRETLEKRGSL